MALTLKGMGVITRNITLAHRHIRVGPGADELWVTMQNAPQEFTAAATVGAAPGTVAVAMTNAPQEFTAAATVGPQADQVQVAMQNEPQEFTAALLHEYESWFVSIEREPVDDPIVIAGTSYTHAALIADDLNNIIVKYDNQAPHTVRMVGLLLPELVDNLSQHQLDTLHQVFDLWVYWSGDWNDYGVFKENRSFEAPATVQVTMSNEPQEFSAELATDSEPTNIIYWITPETIITPDTIFVSEPIE